MYIYKKEKKITKRETYITERVNLLKIFDKFLKFLKTDRNTFLTYILTMLTAYIVVDRVVEILLMIFTGMGVSYWGPIRYTLALACPVFGFLFSFPSKFCKSDKDKVAFFDVYLISLYIIVLSMFTQWINGAGWMLLLSVPNYPYIVSNFSYLIKPAFSALAIYLPLTTFYALIRWLLTVVHDTKDIVDSIGDYGGIDLSDKTIGTGPYTCEMSICRDTDSGKTIKIAEEQRFLQMLVAGISGAGKTSLIFEPMIAKDIDKKFFFGEIAKEMGFTALKTGIANLNGPYDSDYLNRNFSLNMLSIADNKESVYNTYMNKMILGKTNGKNVYRDLGITYLSPDYESISRIKKVADSYKMPYSVIDPGDPNSIGLNPFVYDDALQTGLAIATVLKGLYAQQNMDTVLAFRANAATQAVENIAILLKEIYPRLNDGALPTLEDVQDCLTDFEITEAYCEKLKEIPELKEKHSALIRYFEKNFYTGSNGKDEMEKYVTAAVTQLDTLLRYPGVKKILCNRTNNLNYDQALANGEIVLVCTRRGDLGPNIHSAFGLFFLLLMQYSVLKRPGTEKSRVPHFLYIDEIAGFVNESIEPIFTVYRKYRVATVISIQNLAQLGAKESKYRQTVLSNCHNKIVFGNNSPEDNDWWSLEIGDKREWEYKKTYDSAKGEYTSTKSDIGYNYKTKYKPGKVQTLKFKQCMYKLKDQKGKNMTGKGALDFLSSSFSEPKKIKEYDFEKFTTGGAKTKKDKKARATYNATHLHDNIPDQVDPLTDAIPDEINPIQTDISDSKFIFDNEDAIVINLKNKKQ